MYVYDFGVYSSKAKKNKKLLCWTNKIATSAAWKDTQYSYTRQNSGKLKIPIDREIKRKKKKPKKSTFMWSKFY